MSAQLQNGWLARELKAVQEEFESWPEGLRRSFEAATTPSSRPQHGGGAE